METQKIDEKKRLVICKEAINGKCRGKCWEGYPHELQGRCGGYCHDVPYRGICVPYYAEEIIVSKCLLKPSKLKAPLVCEHRITLYDFYERPVFFCRALAKEAQKCQYREDAIVNKHVDELKP